MIDRRAILAGATTLAGATALAEVAAARNPEVAWSYRGDCEAALVQRGAQ
jgi:hypothetical protein